MRPGLSNIERLFARSSIEVGYAVREYVEDGFHYCEVVNPDTGSLHGTRCVVVGGIGNPIGAPSAEWNANGPYQGEDVFGFPLVVIARRSGFAAPLVLMAVGNPEAQYATTVSTQNPPPPTVDQDDDDAIEVGDFVIAHHGTKIIIRKTTGAIVIRAASNVSLQLNGNIMRVASGGDSTGRVLLATPTVDKLNEVITAFETLKSMISTAISTLGAVPTATTLATAIKGAVDLAPSVSDAVASQLQASILHVSAATGD